MQSLRCLIVILRSLNRFPQPLVSWEGVHCSRGNASSGVAVSSLSLQQEQEGTWQSQAQGFGATAPGHAQCWVMIPWLQQL